MDHLPKPLNPIFAYPSIQYVCLEEYDCKDFRDHQIRADWSDEEVLDLESPYPLFCLEEFDFQEFRDYAERAGWSDDEIFDSETWEELGKEGHRSVAEAKSFLQTWLYFGSLRAFFGNLVCFDDFIDKHPFKPPSIHTRNLMHAAGEFLRKIEHNPLDRRSLDALGHVLEFAQRVYGKISECCTLDPNFMLSIAFLLDFLKRLHSDCLRDADATDLNPHVAFKPPMVVPNAASRALLGNHGRVDFLNAELASSGWCPRLVSKLEGESLSFRYYALYLGPPDDQRDHDSCTLAYCVAYQIDKGRYTHRHAEEKCNCQHMEPDLEEIRSTLRSGHIPLIQTQEPMKKEHATLLSTSEPGIKYVAISHVWSDGLGNPLRNSIAYCQMRKICRAVDSLPNGSDLSAFWLDTLCCPIEPREMRSLAIRKMKETYQQADAVLVLDGELEKLSLKETPLTEIAIRLFTSGWTGRLWTWQEGALSKRLYFLLSDGPLYFKDIFCFMLSRYTEKSLMKYSGILTAFGSTMDLVQVPMNMSEKTVTTTFDIVDIHTAIAGRTTSVLDDEPICVGAMMNIDLLPILDAKPADRMCEFWKQLPSVPLQVIFLNVPQLTKPGVRWAPRTLLDRNIILYHGSPATGTPTSRGLQIYCRGFLFLTPVNRPINYCFWLRDASGGWPGYVSNGKGGGVYQVPTLDDTEETYTHAALLIREELTTAATIDSALVYVYADIHGILYARRSMHTVIHSTDQLRYYFPLLEQLENTERERVEESGPSIAIDGVYHAVECRALSEDQAWCID